MEGTISDVLEGRATWALVHGNNADVLPTLADKSVAHVITDPPYGEWTHAKRAALLAGSGGRGAYDGCERATDLGFASISAEQRLVVAAELARASVRWVLQFSDFETSADWIAANGAAKLDHVRLGIWVKPGSSPQFSGDRPAVGAEAIVIAHASGRKRWNGGGKHGVWTHPIVPGTNPERTEHTTQKPVPLMLELVELFTDPNELVLDPFAGSGTTGVACLRLGRRFIGIEREAKYVEIARERLRAEENGQSLRDARAGQLPMFPEASK